MILFLFFFAALVVLIVAGFWYESTPWRWCRRCGRYYNLKTGREYNYCPSECDGIVKQRDCKECESCEKGAK